MTAALAQPQAQPRRGDGLKPTNFVRDLRQIADLIELCFADSMDSSGRAAIGEMKALSFVPPLVVILALLDRLVPGLGSGYVWRVGGRVVGNTSLYRAGRRPDLGPGWLIANVAVHPDWRRQGIARAMMQATIERIRQKGGGWVALQVAADNVGARRLYEGLGFETFETLVQWEVYSFSTPHDGVPQPLWPEGIHARQVGEAALEADLIFNRARRGAMVWTHPIENHDIWDSPLENLSAFLRAAPKAHWLMDDPAYPSRLAAALWVESGGWHYARMSLFVDPALAASRHEDLLEAVLDSGLWDGFVLRLDAPDEDALALLLEARGFRRVRALTQMRLQL